MKRILFFVLLLTMIFFESCEFKKSYKYIEVISDESVFGGVDIKEKEPKTIMAISDSAAYLEAYQSFCISQKVNNDIKEAMGKVYSTPIKFKLMDKDGNDITNSVYFENKEKLEKEIENKIFSMNNSIKESVDKSKEEKIESFRQTAKIDSLKIKELKPYFLEKKDEFDPNGLVWHKPKSAPQYTNMNGIYCYFQSNKGMPSNLRFRIQYYADDWLFFNKVQFSIDGKAYEYIPSDTETDSGNGGKIWEWFDEPVRDLDKELLNALANAKSAKMKFIGRQYYDIKTVSATQISDIKRTIDLFQAMGGNY
jgi:hypothetical protein